MSTVITGKLKGIKESNYNISLESGNIISYPGIVVQFVSVRSDAKTTYASAITGDGTTITDLNLTITPKYSNSILVVNWMLCGEVAENNMFLIHRDGALITDTGYQAYNTVYGNVRYSGFVPAYYDADSNSTAAHYKIQYHIPAGSTTARTYAPAVRSSTSTAYTFYMNRTQGSTGADNHEQQVSMGYIMEISQ